MTLTNVTLAVNDVITCRAGDVLDLRVFTDSSTTYVMTAAASAAASGAINGTGFTGVSNYFSVELVSPY